MVFLEIAERENGKLLEKISFQWEPLGFRYEIDCAMFVIPLTAQR